MTTDQDGTPAFEEIAVRVDNEFGLVAGSNLPNHTASMAGRGQYVMVTQNQRGLQFRTRQQAYRLVAHLLALTDTLPDEDGEHTLEQVQQAVESSLAE